MRTPGRHSGLPAWIFQTVPMLAMLLSLLPLFAVGLDAQEAGETRLYPRIQAGEWVRIANLRDADGRFQPRQEHSAVELNGFVYLIGGFVPRQPPPTPTEEDPEPFPFVGTDEVLAYVPAGHPAAGPAGGAWRSLDQPARFPQADYHHIISVAHQGQIWSFGGHAGSFAPTDTIFRFTPNDPGAPDGSWSMVRVADGQPCDPTAEECLRLPAARAAGAAVSLDSRIFVLGGVEPNTEAGDPVNESIRTTASVLSLDTTTFPLAWEAGPPLLASREHFNAVVVGGRVWVFHGRSERSTHMRGVESWAPGEAAWQPEPEAPIGTSANVLAAVGDCVYSFGGEFIASNVTGTLHNSQVFHVPSRTWRLLDATFSQTPLDASGAASKHGTYGIPFVEDGLTRIMAPGGAATAWFDPMSRVHVFIPPDRCDG
jgi:hypothetical protein